MKISILMPTYDCPRDLLSRSLMSVFEQTHKDVEIVIKDGSVNNPALNDVANLDLYLSKYPEQIKYVCSPETTPSEQLGRFRHNGFYEALNQCIEMATGDILCLLCSDDDRGPIDTLEYVNEEFERRDKSPFFLYGACDWIDRDGRYLETKTPPVVTFESLLRDYTLFTPSLFWNKAVHENFGFFNEKLAWCADVDFWLRCWRGMETKQTLKVLGRYRVWGTSQARANESELWKQSRLIQENHRGA